MSKVIYLCFRNTKLERELTSPRNFEMLSERLTPDNIIPNPVRCIHENGIAIGIVNPVKSLKIEGTSVCLGALMDPIDDWYKPGAPVPDGNYALFRGDRKTVEVITDVVASRTVWYYYDEEVFIASTSQRAIVMFLRSLSFNTSVIPWVLSSGKLGYGHSWDSRIKKLEGDSVLTIDRSTWNISVNTEAAIFNPKQMSLEQCTDLLNHAYVASFDRLHLSDLNCTLTLSGGYDSRAVLLLLHKKNVISRCVTWGTLDALRNEGSDASIANELARYYNYAYTYFKIEFQDGLVDSSMRRFLIAGEGRRDSINAYMDGLAAWKDLFEVGDGIVLRGDIALNSRAAVNENQVMRSQGITRLSDYSNYDIVKKFHFESQELHEKLRRRADESLVLYSVRLHQIYNIPYHLAALNDIKCSYVEVVNPLLNRQIVYTLRCLTEEALLYKNAHKRTVEKLSPNIPWAKDTADQSMDYILYNPVMVEYLRCHLRRDFADHIISSSFKEFIIDNMVSMENSGLSKSTEKIYAKLKRLVSSKSKQKLSAYISRQLDYNRLALRTYIISQMYRLLREDSQVFCKERNHIR